MSPAKHPVGGSVEEEDTGTRGHGDAGTRGHGDTGTRGHGERLQKITWEIYDKKFPTIRVPASPTLCVPVSLPHSPFGKEKISKFNPRQDW
ncbi:MAG: hypothetical protein RMY36_026520 [Nostoc sp. SerVER01]|nr:hypothetical protein [Nostoc sp. SerVER01]